jgi:hypothetical protein
VEDTQRTEIIIAPGGKIMNKLWLVGITILLALSTASCSTIARSGNQTKKTWSIDQAGLKALIDKTNQGKSEADRLLLTIDRVEFSKKSGIKVYGACPFANAPSKDGEFGISLINQDSRIRMEISVGNECGIQRDDPRVAVMNSDLSNALAEKIAADCGKVLVDWIQLSENQLTVSYVNSN